MTYHIICDIKPCKGSLDIKSSIGTIDLPGIVVYTVNTNKPYGSAVITQIKKNKHHL